MILYFKELRYKIESLSQHPGDGKHLQRTVFQGTNTKLKAYHNWTARFDTLHATVFQGTKIQN